MSKELLIAERLNMGRLLLRGLGASVVLSELIGFGYLLTGLARAGHPLPGWNAPVFVWATHFPVAAVSAAIALICPTALAVIAATWLPTRRKFRFDRASAYEMIGRYRVRYRLEDIELQSGPPRLLVNGKTHHISKADWERLTSFYRALANERTSFVRPAAMGGPTSKPGASLKQMLNTRVA